MPPSRRGLVNAGTPLAEETPIFRKSGPAPNTGRGSAVAGRNFVAAATKFPVCRRVLCLVAIAASLRNRRRRVVLAQLRVSIEIVDAGDLTEAVKTQSSGSVGVIRYAQRKWSAMISSS